MATNTRMMATSHAWKPKVNVRFSASHSPYSSAELPQKNLDRFEKWLSSLGHQRNGIKISSSNSGFTAIAEREFKENELMAEVPCAAFMNTDTAKLNPALANLSLDPWRLFMAHLLWEVNLGESSFWYPYLSLLPAIDNYPYSHPLHWDRSLVDDWVAGLPMLKVMEKRHSQIRSDTAALLATEINEVAPRGTLSCLVSEENVNWASSMLLRRAVSIDLASLDEDEGRFLPTLVPWADLLSHRKRSLFPYLAFDFESNSAKLTAHRNYVPGEEVFDFYGPGLTPAQLLLDEELADKKNVVELPIHLLGKPESLANKELLCAAGMPLDKSVLVLNEEGENETDRAWVRALTATRKRLQTSGWLTDLPCEQRRANIAMAYFSSFRSELHEVKVLKRLYKVSKGALSGYPTTIEEDEEELSALQLEHLDGKQRARESTLIAIISEKKALRGTIEGFDILLSEFFE